MSVHTYIGYSLTIGIGKAGKIFPECAEIRAQLNNEVNITEYATPFAVPFINGSRSTEGIGSNSVQGAPVPPPPPPPLRLEHPILVRTD